MANPEHLAILKQGVKVWNEWRKKHREIEPDFVGAKLGGLSFKGAHLDKANLNAADLSGADLERSWLEGSCLFVSNLRGANLNWAQLARADLRGSDFREANLEHADLSEVNASHIPMDEVSRADFSGANLVSARLDRAKLEYAQFENAKLDHAILTRADLSNANLSKASLQHARLKGAYLCDANMFKTSFYYASLDGANLIGANLVDSILDYSVLENAQLKYAKLMSATLERASLYSADLRHADFTGAILRNVDLQEALLVETNFERADLTGCLVYGISAWRLNLKDAIQTNLIVTKVSPEPPYDRADLTVVNELQVTVDNLDIAQFIYLLLNNKNIRSVIETISRKVVLILGRFTPERKAVLDAIREELRKRDFLPVLFDFDKPAKRDFTETMRTLAHLSRFIIADLSDPKSIPLELQAVVPDLAVPVQPLILSGQDEFSMFVDLRKKYHWVLATHRYTDIADLLASLGDKVIAPAEAKAKELEKR